MKMDEMIARRLCKYHGVNPDARGWGVGNKEPKDPNTFFGNTG